MLKRLYYIFLQRWYVFKKKSKPCQGKVYMFHNVNDDKDTYSISKEHFVSFIDYLSKNKKIVDIRTLIEEKDPDNVVLTFDDVYDSVYENAYPLLKENGVPYYLFVCNEYLDKKAYLTSSMVEEMLKNSKAVLGSHNYYHELSRFVDAKIVKERMMESKKQLEDRFNIVVEDFAFPYGSIYACSNKNIEDASFVFEHVFMTYGLDYNKEYGNIIPRINMNDAVFEKEMS